MNWNWNTLITGFSQLGVVGLDNKPIHVIDTRAWVAKKPINFYWKKKLRQLTPESMPTFAFYHLMGHVKHLPRTFWAYLQGSNIHNLDLEYNKIGAEGARALAQCLAQTHQIHSLGLWGNDIGAEGAKALAQYLPQTQIHNLDLGCSEIGDEGTKALAECLPQTQIHMLDLSANNIGDEGAKALAQCLSQTQIHTLHLWNNNIGAEMEQFLREQHPDIKCWWF